MASAQRTSPSLRLAQDGDDRARVGRWEQLPLPGHRLFLVAAVAFGWSAAGPALAVFLGWPLARRHRQCSARGPWVCCARHRRQHREAYGCRDCRADLLSWRPRPRPTKPYSLGTVFTRRERSESKGLQLHRLPVLPATYGECMTRTRPCYLFRCRHNLWLDVHPESGSIKLNFPGLEPHEVPHTCSIDAAMAGLDQSGDNVIDNRPKHTLEQVAEWMNMTTVRAGQLVTDALAEAKAKMRDGDFSDRGTDEVDEFADEPTTTEKETDDGE